MAYAPKERNFYDADSHVMELPNFIIDYADEEFNFFEVTGWHDADALASAGHGMDEDY